MVKIVLQNSPRKKRPSRRLRWEDGMKRDAVDLYPDTDWHTLASNGDG